MISPNKHDIATSLQLCWRSTTAIIHWAESSAKELSAESVGDGGDHININEETAVRVPGANILDIRITPNR